MSALTVTDLIQILLILILSYLAYIDARTFRLPDVITLPLLLIGLIFNAMPSLQLVSLQDSFFGALLGYTSLWLLNRLYRYAKQQNGIGMGDAKLLAALGAWLGWNSLPSILLIASISGILGGLLWLKLNKQKQGDIFPFGPFLIFAGIIELLWPQLLQTLLLSNPT
jgi:leader peptidase (prepilin peptidase)/N-methyltransferase